MTTLDTALHVSAQYHRFLQTTMRFRDEELADTFEAAMANQPLMKGPLLEGTPVFRRGTNMRQLINGISDIRADEGFLRALEADRRLYKHQEDAIRRVLQGRNTVVATGTGSGKTECFLYPIILDLLRQHNYGALDSGVRALVLYPMNALANDQRDRLAAPPLGSEIRGGILHELMREKATLKFSFGQYTGQTPEEPQRKNGEAFRGEISSRIEMRASPPHLLLTNFSMLEYLLLRPSDSPLFSTQNKNTWRYLVLDEAHQYRGTKGIEVAMLIRRLKQRLRDEGHVGEFRCIATSASLASGTNSRDKDRETAAKFASDLFGEPFDAEDVLFGETEPLQDVSVLQLQPNDYEVVFEALNDCGTESCNSLFERYAVPAGTLEKRLSWLMLRDAGATRLRQAVLGKPVSVDDLASTIFLGVERHKARGMVGRLAESLARLRNESGAPLLTGRYHLLLKAMETAYVTYSPKKRVLVDERRHAQKSAFEVAVCRECGQHYFVGIHTAGYLHEAVRDPGSTEFKVRFYRPLYDDDDIVLPQGKDSLRVLTLCTECGAMQATPLQCGCDASMYVRVVEEHKSEAREDQVTRCGACGYGGGSSDPVREMTHGHDAPQAVVATSLLSSTPEERRKLLAFSDGRQEAAFFAWYFEQSYRDLLSRNLICAALRGMGDQEQDLARLARGVVGKIEDAGLTKAYELSAARTDLAFLTVMREALTVEKRISLEGVGLVRWRWGLPHGFRIPKVLQEAPFALTELDSLRVINVVLDTLRESKSVEINPPMGTMVSYADLGLQPVQQSVALYDPEARGSASRRNNENWDGPNTRRVLWLSKLVRRKDPSISFEKAREFAVRALLEIWDAIHDSDKLVRLAHQRLFMQRDSSRRINMAWLRVKSIGDDEIVYRCDRCGRLQYDVVADCCHKTKCDGIPRPIRLADLPIDHYRNVYVNHLPGELRAEEHTAQLRYEKAREIQADFKLGNIHLLSSSTTFEVGVDLGDLSTVLLRNVPPEAFNYAQRVGRAGRRMGTLGLAVTYCRRNPHDLYHFLEPHRIILGKSAPPVLSLRNDKIIRRHVVAWTLADFFRSNPQNFGSVREFTTELSAPNAVAKIRAHVLTKDKILQEQLMKIVPDATQTMASIRDGTWIEDVIGENSRLQLAEIELQHTFESLKRFQDESALRGEYDNAKWARQRADTLQLERVLDFLSRQSVIPKYGFPVDVVALDTSIAASDVRGTVDLQRDLSVAISEFAPTAEIIANKLSWKSYGLKRIPAREWPRWQYRRCKEHGAFVQWQEDQEPIDLPCGCSVKSIPYIVPQFGFTTSRKIKVEEPKKRPQRIFSTRPFFVGSVSEEPETLNLCGRDGKVVMQIGRASPGRMAVISEGAKGQLFHVCPKCGYGTTKPEGKHDTPMGGVCNGMLRTVALGHVFETDVLRLWFPIVGVHDSIYYKMLGAAFALADGSAEILEVPSTDLNAVVTVATKGVPQIVLYDNVPGGAGLVSRLENTEVFMRALSIARERVSGRCGCRHEDSCYACLRSYSNQYAHAKLKRGDAWEFLSRIADAL